jgi:hypothetical protein
MNLCDRGRPGLVIWRMKKVCSSPDRQPSHSEIPSIGMSKILKIGLWTIVLAVLLLMRSVGRPRDVLANPDPDIQTTAEEDDNRVAYFTDKPLPVGLTDKGVRSIQDKESDLDHVMVDVSNPEAAIAHDSDENFYGRFTVNAGASDKNASQ